MNRLSLYGMVLCIVMLLFSTMSQAYEYEISIIKTASNKAYDTTVDGFINEFRTLGYNEGENTRTAYYDLKQLKNNEDQIIKGINDVPTDFILAVGTNAARFAKNSFAEIPIVFVMVYDADEFSNSGNMTGVLMKIAGDKQIQEINTAIPSANTIGIIYSNENSSVIIQNGKQAMNNSGLTSVEETVTSELEVKNALEQIISEIDLLWLVPDPIVSNPDTPKRKQTLNYLFKYTLEKKVPVAGFAPYHVKKGAVLSITVDFSDMGRQSALIAHDIINGTSPNSISFQNAEPFLFINKKIANYMNITIPSSILDKAKVVLNQ